MGRSHVVATVASLVVAGCAAISGLDDFDLATTSTTGSSGSGSGGIGGGASTTSGGGGGGGAPEGWWDAAFGSRRKIVFDNRDGGEALLDFPVVVRLAAEDMGAGTVSPTGADLRFIDADGVTVLAHEIERWDAAEGGYVWVRVPRIEPNATDDHIWLYYGNPDAGDAQAPPSVWGGFLMVHHFREGILAADSKGVYNGDLVGTVELEPAGRIAGALLLSGAGNIQLTGISELSAAVNEQRTIEAWFKTGSAGQQYVLSQESACKGYGIQMGAQADQLLRGRLSTATASNCTGVQQSFAHAGAAGFSDDQWHYVALVIDRSQGEMRLFVDGIEVGTSAVNQTANARSDTIWIGAEFGDTSRFEGSIDEVRVSGSARSSEWIAAQYRSMTDGFTIIEKSEHLR